MDPALIADAAGAPAHELTFWSLFLRADPVVKSVMGMLAIASVWSWAIIFEKGIRLNSLKRQTDKFEEQFWSGRPLNELYDSLPRGDAHPMAAMFTAAMREWRRWRENGSSTVAVGEVKDRVARVMNVAMNRQMSKVEGSLGILATVGSVSPFVGLFGTVWGIMNSFQAIALTKDTSLAVLAPPIAEALFATALGLVAAIPAVIFYNNFVNQANRLGGRLEGFMDEFSAIMSRRIEEEAR